jgi:hypothetical protein
MRTTRRSGLAILTIVMFTVSCATTNRRSIQPELDPELLHSAVKQLTDVMVHDIFSPPQASRGYAYPSIAAYEVLAADNREHLSLAGQLRGLEPVPSPDEGELLRELSAVHAFLNVATAIVFSEDKIIAFHGQMLDSFRKAGVSDDVFDRSVEYGNRVSAHILGWADADNYRETRTFAKYSVVEAPGRWIPTPPAYLDGIEPHWNQIRPFVLTSADQFKPAPPTPYSMEPGSPFYDEAYEVYRTGTDLSDEEAEIAAFWDCNPFVMRTRGHVMFSVKKITPGGHWMGISAIAARLADADLMTAAETYALVSIALSDAFISSWDEKYRSNLIRPETVINRHIDPDWMPLLQTPPFPEYTSGHSVISTAASIVLTRLYGDDFAFDDTTEVEYGLPIRTFTSFKEAAAEAAISRLYGGIHYMPAITEGVKQGRDVGNFVLDHVTLRRKPLATSIRAE